MEEKMLILKMLQEGKITTDDALKLLEALESGSTTTNSSGSRINEIKDELSAKLNEIKFDEKLNKFSEKASKLAETLGEKAGKLAGQLSDNINAEKISNNTEKFTEEFAKKMENLGQDILESASKFADTFANQLGSLFETGYEKYKYSSTYTYPISEGSNIFLKTTNFSIKVSPSEAKEMSVNIFANSNIPQLVIDEYFKTISEDNSYRFSSEFPGRTWGRIELLLPKGIDVISLSTDNAKCEINNIDPKYINCSTTNGKITIAKCSVENIDAKTSNAPIIANISRKSNFLNSNYIFNTSNGKIDFGMRAEESSEHMIDAHTTMNNIDVNLTNLTYTIDKKNLGMQSNVQLKSENFDTSPNKIIIRAATSNAPISIRNI